MSAQRFVVVGFVGVVASAIGCLNVPVPKGTNVACTSDTDCAQAGGKCAPLTQTCSPADDVAPGPIADLRVDLVAQPPTDSSLTLLWTAPGDDGSLQNTKATRYTLSIVKKGETTPVKQKLAQDPQASGAPESFLVEGLTPATLYTFSVRADDEFANGLESNFATGATAGVIACTADADCAAGDKCSQILGTCTKAETVPPGPVTDLRVDRSVTSATSLTLEWTAPGDDGQAANTAAAHYALQYSVVNDVPTSQGGVVSIARTPALAGTPESFELQGLGEGTVYDITLVVTDAADNTSTTTPVRATTLGAAACTTSDQCESSQLCSTLSHVCTDVENVPPGPINDLNVDSADDTSIAVRFTAPGDDGFRSGTSAAQYVVQWTPVGGDLTNATAGSLEIDDPGVANAPELVHVTGLVAATLYSVVVDATDDAGNESQSNTVLAATVGAVQCHGDDAQCRSNERCALEGPAVCVVRENVAPGAITDLHASDADATSLLLRFTEPGDDGAAGGGAVQRYVVHRALVSGGPADTSDVAGPTPVGPTTLQSIRVDNLVAGAVYAFTIEAFDDNGNTSTSNAVQGAALTAGGLACVDDSQCPTGQRCAVIVPQVCTTDESTAPGPVTITNGGVTSTSVTIDWISPGDDGFGAGTSASSCSLTVTPRNESSFNVALPTPKIAGTPDTFDVTGLEPGHIETIAMTCSDDLGNAATSAPLVVATAGAVVCTNVGAGDECAPGDFCSAELFDVGGGTQAHVCTLDENIAPGPISDLNVVPSGTTLTSLTLRFSAPGDDGFAPGTRAKRYVAHVRDITHPGSPPTSVPLDLVTPGVAFSTETVVITGLDQGVDYDISMEAVDDAGNSTLSTAVQAETGGAVCPPDPQTGRRVVTGALFASNDENLVRLTGCDDVVGDLTLDMTQCGIRALNLLDGLHTISGRLTLITNPLCANSDDLTILPALTDLGTLIVDDQLQVKTLTLAGAQHIGTLSLAGDPVLTSIALPLLSDVDVLTVERGFKAPTIALPTITEISNTLTISTGKGVNAVDLSGLTHVENAQIAGGPDLATLDLSSLSSAGSITIGDANGFGAELATLGTVALPALTTAANVDVAFVDASAVDLPVLTSVAGRFAVHDSRALQSLNVPLLHDVDTFFVGFGGGNVVTFPPPSGPMMASLSAPALVTARSFTIQDIDNLASIDFSALATVGTLTITATPSLTSAVSFPSVTTAGDVTITENTRGNDPTGKGGGPGPGPSSLAFAQLTTSGKIDIEGIATLTTLSLPSLLTANAIHVAQLPALSTLSLPVLTQTTSELFVDCSATDPNTNQTVPGPGPSTIAAPVLTTIGTDLSITRVNSLSTLTMNALHAARSITVQQVTPLASVSFPALTTMTGGITMNQATSFDQSPRPGPSTLNVPALTTAAFISLQSDASITAVSLPAATSIAALFAFQDSGLVSIDAPRLTTMSVDGVCHPGFSTNGLNVQLNNSLQTLNLPALTLIQDVFIGSNPALATINVPANVQVGVEGGFNGNATAVDPFANHPCL